MSARDELLARLTAEQHNGGGWKTPPTEWNAAVSTAGLANDMPAATADDDVVRARRRREALAEWEAAHEEEATA